MINTAPTLLKLDKICAGYGSAEVLFEVSFTLNSGEVVALTGRNGMGKTTLVKTLFGLLRPRSGNMFLFDQNTEVLSPYQIARLGLGLVPEGRHIFPTLNVHENLIAAARTRDHKPKWTATRVYELFPTLGDRRKQSASHLSGGEQQMLAIGRALMTNPALLVLDEATEGLAPLIRLSIWQAMTLLKSEGQTILIIDKHIDQLTRLVDRHLVLEKGRVVWEGTNVDFKADPTIRKRWLGI